MKTPLAKLKHAARKAVKYAWKTGRLRRLPCAECGAKNAEAHHADYSAPLDVLWLCRKHHVQLHRRLKGHGAPGPRAFAKRVEAYYLAGMPYKEAYAVAAGNH